MRHLKYLLSLIGLVILIFSFQILTWEHLEFRTQDLYDNYRYFSLTFYLIVSIAIYYLLPKNEFREIINGLGLIGLIIGLVFLLIYVFPFGLISDVEKDNKTLFVNKLDSNKKIIEQIYWTGITSDHEHYDTILTEELFKNVRWTKKVDINQLNRNEWLLIRGE